MNTQQKGEVAKLQVLLRAAEKGLVASEPTTPARYDLVIDDQGKLERVQVKWGGRASVRSQGAITVDLRSDQHSKRSLVYQLHEVDSLMVWIPEQGVVRIPAPDFVGKRSITIRWTAPKNNQRSIYLVEDYRW